MPGTRFASAANQKTAYPMAATSTRRTHNKTRLGCSQCKKRRIKCDCSHPRCANCEKRGEDCSFLLLAPSTRLTAGSACLASTSESTSTYPISSSSASPNPERLSPSTQLVALSKRPYQVQVFRGTSILTPSPSPPRTPPPLIGSKALIPCNFPSISPFLRYNNAWQATRERLPPELQGILYHYEYTTSITIAEHDPAKTAWQTFIPELAAEHQYLVHNVLSIASLHLARLHVPGPEKAAMTNLAASQMNKAIARFRPQLTDINADNAAALFACTTLTAVFFFRTATQEIDDIRASVPAGTLDPPTEIVDRMLNCSLKTIWGLRGPWTVLVPGISHILRGNMSPVADRTWWPEYRVPATEHAKEEDRRLAQIEKLWQGPDGGPDVDCLSSALFFLRETFALVSQLTVPGNNYPSSTEVAYSIDDVSIGCLKDRGAIFVWGVRISPQFIHLLAKKNREALVIMAHYAILAARVRNVWWLEGMGANFVVAVAMALGRENWHLIEWPVRAVGVDLENAFTLRPDRLEGEPGEMAMEVI